MDGKKISITPEGLMLLFPATGVPDEGGVEPVRSEPITAEEFEAQYREFLSNRVSPEDFARLCDLALAQGAGPLPEAPEAPDPEELLADLLAELPEPPQHAGEPPEGLSAEEWRARWAIIDPRLWREVWPQVWPQVWRAEQERSAREIYVLKYLALMKQGRYFEALGIAGVMEKRFGDTLKALEIRCTVHMRRDNVDAALSDIGALLAHCREHGLDCAEYEQDRLELVKRKERTACYQAGRFWREVSRDRASAFAKFAGVPIILRGRAILRVNRQSRDRYLIFEPEGDSRKWISCQLPGSELPFISRVRFPAEAEVHGYLLNASESLILLYPARFLRVVGD